MEENLENVTEKLEQVAENLENEDKAVVDTAEGVASATAGVAEQEPAQEPRSEQEAPKSCENKKCKCHLAHLIFDLLMLAAVITLFVLHFADRGKPAVAVEKPAEVGNGEIVYVNIDTINEHYDLIKILTDSIDADKQKQAVVFQNRQRALEQKYSNFQQNYSSGSLNAEQVKYAQESLEMESASLQRDYAQALESLEARYLAAQQQMNDSLIAAAKRVNAVYNASYIFAYQGSGGSQLLYGDPAHDITQEVLDELNKPFNAKKK